MTQVTPDQLLPILRELEGSDRAAAVQSRRLGRTVTADEVVSQAGAIGRHQIMPATAKALGFDPTKLTDSTYNETVAKAALNDLIRQHGVDDAEAVIAGYNASPKVVNRWKRGGRNINLLPTETRGYLERARPLLAALTPVHVEAEPQGPPGAREYQKLLDSGFPQADAEAWREKKTTALQGAGYSQNEIDAYWGTHEVKTPDLDDQVRSNVAHNWTPDDAQKADDPLGYLAAGWDMSSSALALGGPPKTVLPENAGVMAEILFGLGQFTGDIPAGIAGFVGGGAAGTAAGAAVSGPAAPIGGVVGAFGGSAALPEAMRQVLMDQYRNGGFTTFKDFLTRSTAMAWDTAKAGIIGGVSGPIGRGVGGKVLEKVGSRAVASAAEATAFAGAATATGGALNGHIPDAKDFGVAVATMLTAHVAVRAVGATGRAVLTQKGEQAAENMQQVYARTGVPPWEQAQRAENNLVVRQEILSQDADGRPVTPTLEAGRPREPEPFANLPAPEKLIKETEDLGSIQSQEAANQLQAIAENDVNLPATVGPAKINPDLARTYGFDPTRLSEPAYNTMAARAILTELSNRFRNADGSVDRVAVTIAYISGPGRAVQFRGDGRNFAKLPPTTQRYLEQSERLGAFGEGPPEPPKPGGAGGGQGDEPPRIEGATPEPDPFDLNSAMLADRINDITAQPVKPSMLDRARDIPRQAYFEAVSELAPFKRLDKEMSLPVDEIGLEDMYRSTYASPGRAFHFIRYGTLKPLDITEEGAAKHFVKTSDEYLFKGYEEAKRLGVTPAELVAYRRAMRTAELSKRGVETPTALRDAEAMIEKVGEKLKPVAELFDRVNDAKIDYMRDSGLLSGEMAKAIKDDNRYWIPYNPAREGGYRRTGARFSPTQPLKKIRGGQYQTVDPIPMEIQSFYNAIANADKNRAAVSLMSRLTPEIKATLGLREITDQRAPVELFDKYGNPVPEVQATLGPLNENQFAYFDNGVRRVMQVDDPQLARAIRGASPQEVDILWRSMRLFAQVKRSGIVEMPDYMARAMVKDVVGAKVLEKWGGANLAQLLDAASHVIKGDAVWKDWTAKGGLGTALADIDANYIARDVNKLFTQSGTWSRVVNTFAHPLQAAGVLMQRMDAIVRLAEAEKMKAAGTDPFKATMNARKINLDFSERGASPTIGLLASITPFFRPSMLGMDQLARTVKSDPIGVGLRAATYVAAPIALLYAMNYVQEQGDPTIPDDQKWVNLPRWQKDTMFILPRFGGVRLRVPMPPIIGPVFGGLTNRMLDYFVQSDPKAFNDWANTMWAQFVPPMLPAVGLPIYEHFANRSSFSGRPLVPAALEGAHGYMQYVDYTSEIAKRAAQFIGPPGLNLADVSPMILDNYVRGWTGPMGQQIMRVFDAAVFPEGRKPWDVADIPIIGSFVVRNPGMGAQPIQDFYDGLKEVRMHNRDLALAIDRQNVQEIDWASASVQAFIRLEGIAKTLSMQRGIIDKIDSDMTMPIDDKRQLLESFYSQMIAESSFGLSVIESITEIDQAPAPATGIVAPPPRPEQAIAP